MRERERESAYPLDRENRKIEDFSTQFNPFCFYARV